MPVVADAAVKTKAKTVAKKKAKIDYNCGDFATRAAMLKVYKAAGGPAKDPYRLDGDKDGIPCEDL